MNEDNLGLLKSKEFLSPEEKKMLIEKDEDWINAPDYQNSMYILLNSKESKSELTDAAIRRALLISQEELEILFKSAIRKLRRSMKNEGFDGL